MRKGRCRDDATSFREALATRLATANAVKFAAFNLGLETVGEGRLE